MFVIVLVRVLVFVRVLELVFVCELCLRLSVCVCDCIPSPPLCVSSPSCDLVEREILTAVACGRVHIHARNHAHDRAWLTFALVLVPVRSRVCVSYLRDLMFTHKHNKLQNTY